ncbi:alanyl-tRNA editing protein [Paucidesulfovibrio longus]|uniref:hypothetical protein n=1 Tax=Paucidesulfovibrio longus TaxID=889 RepID=UPI0003B3A790|nr:hypothetical protein [Paucidesulfovibrio longus]
MAKIYDERMHTAEHVLNQAMVRTFGCGRCFSAHINKKKSKCDYRFERPITDAEAAALEALVNEQLARDLPVREELLSRERAAREFDLSRLPEEAGDEVRIVRVGDFDACPCIGPHAASTAELGQMRIISHDFENGVLRLRFKLDAS